MSRKIKKPLFVPADLVDDSPLDEDMVANAMIAAEGNVTEAAEILHVDSSRLRSFILMKPYLKRALDERIERGVDKAIDVLFEGLHKKGPYVDRLQAAKEFLKTGAAGRRGFRANAQAIEIQAKHAHGAPIVLRWQEPKPLIIEGQVNAGNVKEK